MVVIGIIVILTAAVGIATSGARQRALVARATQETKEMTNAILAFEQYARGHTLEDYAKGNWQDCTESSMAMILGRVKGDNGEDVPVLYNAGIKGGKLLDPWGRPYQYRIEKSSWSADGQLELLTSPALPNYFRLTDKEKQ